MSRRWALWLAALVLATLALAEVLLSPPNADERLRLLLILGAPALVTAAIVPMLARWVSSRASVAGAALMVGLCSLAVAAATTSAASNAMFLSSHDFRLFLVVLILSCGIALLVGAQLTRPLAHDIAALGRLAEHVADGDLTIRMGSLRRDEVGQTARAIDRMIDALAAADTERTRAADARQMLFSSIGHDLRTPLAAMRAAIESLQDGVAPDPERYLNVLGTQVDHIEVLLDQLVEYARIESGDRFAARERVSLAELADEAAEALSPVADRVGVRVAVSADDASMVVASTLEMSRALRNLIENAIHHSPAGGTVRVALVADADGTELRVSDEGPGFPADFRERAFEPFTRADTARTGRNGHAGLGLTITRAIVEAHGGRIWLGEAPGGDVRVWLPAASLPQRQQS